MRSLIKNEHSVHWCRFQPLKIVFALVIVSMASCTTINVDHIQLENSIEIAEGEAVVVLGRRHTARVETESSLVSCLGDNLSGNLNGIRVIEEELFVNQFYPWFETRVAPQSTSQLIEVFKQPGVEEQVNALGIKYIVWVKGSTERTAQRGSLSCTIGPGGAGCFGFGTWEDTSDYETTIWDIQALKEVGRVSTDAVGTSYMPAFVVPVPMLAGVENDACRGMGRQLVGFFNQSKNEIKRAE